MGTTEEQRWRRMAVAGTGALLLAAGLAGPPRVAGASDGGVTERVSVASDGTQADDHSVAPAISADGRYVAFQSWASLVEDDTGIAVDVFVRDRATGGTTRASVASDGTQADSHSGSPAISADGRYVAFQSEATNLVDGDTNGVHDIFVRDRDTGLTTRVSVASDGSQTEAHSFRPAISADGRYVAFDSGAANLVDGDTNGDRDHGCCGGDVFVHDRETGTTERVSVASDGSQADNNSDFAAISADGRHVAFVSFAANLVPGDTNETFDVFVHDRDTGTTTRVNVASDGTQDDGFISGEPPGISADGRYVAFHSLLDNLVAGDTNETADVFVHDRDTGTTELVSIASDGTQANDASLGAAISADGRYVAFGSGATNLVEGDTNGSDDPFNGVDVFVHDRTTRTTTRVSVASDGTEADRASGSAAISADGRHVAFESEARNLVAGDTNFVRDIFVHGPPPGSSEPPGTPPPAGFGFDGDPATSERVDQPDPTSAAIAVSQLRFAAAAEYVVVSRDDDFPDSLAGASLSGEGPLLLTDSTALTPATRQEIGRVLPAGGRVYLLGGPAAISEAVADALAADGYQTVRLAGPTRVETALAVADEVRSLYPDTGQVALARASGPADNPTAGWADSVTGGAWAAAARVPILVTQTDSLHPQVAGWLDRNQPTQTVLLGGAAALSGNVEAAVPNPRRVSGAERAATAAAIATDLTGAPASGPRRFVIIHGYHSDGWAYGLVAAGLAADASAPLLLVHTSIVPDATANLAGTCGEPQVDLLIMGDAAIITTDIQNELDTLDGQSCS